MFEPKSTLQRLVDTFGYVPHYIKKASTTADPLERFKLTITALIAPIHLCTSQLKPFNPILGETLQYRFPDGSKMYCEHISHHPPISNLLMEDADKKYTFNGSIEMTASMTSNVKYLVAG